LTLVCSDGNADRLLLSAHPIVADEASMAILAKELIQAYLALQQGKEPEFSSSKFSFQSFIDWERNYLESDAAKRSAAFWTEQLAGAPTELNLPTDRPRRPQRKFVAGTHGFRLNEDLSHSLRVLAAEQSLPLRSVLLSAFELLMHQQSHQADLLLGYPMAAREHHPYESGRWLSE
jgi:hypothetical protein